MRLGFMTVRDMRGMPFEEIARWGADNGFAAVDAQMEHLGACADCGIEVGATHLRPRVLTVDEGARVEAQKEAYAIIDEAVARGITRAMIPHSRQPGMTTEESIEVFAKGYGPIAEYCEQYNFKLVMEIYHAHGQWLAITPELIRAVFAAVPSRSLGICLDPSHLVVQGIDYIRATKEFGDRIYYAHAKDTEVFAEQLYQYGIFGKALANNRPFAGWWRYRLPGYGSINWAHFIATLNEVGYDDVLAIEHEDEVYYGSVDLNKKGLLMAKKYLEQFIV